MIKSQKTRTLRLLSVLLAAVILLCAALTPKVDAASTASYYENAVLFWTNVERSRHGLKALKTSSKLVDAAGTRSQELVRKFSHTRPNGNSWKTALSAEGINYGSAAENIASGYSTPCKVVKGWMESDGHRDNILSSKYTHMAAGRTQSDSGKNYWSQLFTGGTGYSDSRSYYSVSPTGVSVDKTSIRLSAGASTTLTGTPSPVYATSEVTCTSSNSKVVKVTGVEVNQFTIKAVANGTATLTVKCGSYSKSVSVTVGTGSSSQSSSSSSSSSAQTPSVNPTISDISIDIPSFDFFDRAFGKGFDFFEFLDAFAL